LYPICQNYCASRIISEYFILLCCPLIISYFVVSFILIMIIDVFIFVSVSVQNYSPLSKLFCCLLYVFVDKYICIRLDAPKALFCFLFFLCLFAVSFFYCFFVYAFGLSESFGIGHFDLGHRYFIGMGNGFSVWSMLQID